VRLLVDLRKAREQLPLFPAERPREAYVRQTAHGPVAVPAGRQRYRVHNYASGASRPADIAGYGNSKMDIGAVAGELSPKAIDYLPAALGQWGKEAPGLFVDSGAFREVDANLRIVRPLEDSDWQKVFRTYATLIGRLSGVARVSVVAPDRIGSQEDSLDRLARYSRPLLDAVDCRTPGAEPFPEVFVPLQRGPRALGALWDASVRALAWPAEEAAMLVPSIPSNKGAVPVGEVKAFLAAHKPRRVHFLGVGPQTKRGQALLAAVQEVSPGTEPSFDSNKISAKVGRTGGAGGGARPITRGRDLWAQTGDSPENVQHFGVWMAEAIPQVLAAMDSGQRPPVFNGERQMYEALYQQTFGRPWSPG
jgi:hypothetical protein